MGVVDGTLLQCKAGRWLVSTRLLRHTSMLTLLPTPMMGGGGGSKSD